MALLFISNVVPDREGYRNRALNRSGNNAVMGICDALPKESNFTLLSCRPVPSFPRGKMFIKGETVRLDSGRDVYIVPTLNIKLLKNLFWGLWFYFYVRKWAKRNSKEKRDVLVYNIYTPPISWLYKAAKKTKSKLTAILYDLGVPPTRLGLSKLTMLGYKMMEKEAEKYIPLLDGRVVINEAIINHYAPGKDYILVDGGISDGIVNRLFPLKETESDHLHLVCAGMLWDQNGTKLILSALKGHPELDVTIHFAGKGIDVPLIEAAAAEDNRVKYEGMLTVDELFKLYERSDVLLNLRIEEDVDFHFPSKLLECMATGKHVISTPIAHAERDYGGYISIFHDITPDGLADLIRQLSDEGKSRLLESGKAARAFMLAHRTWAERTKEIMNYLNRDES